MPTPSNKNSRLSGAPMVASLQTCHQGAGERQLVAYYSSPAALSSALAPWPSRNMRAMRRGHDPLVGLLLPRCWLVTPLWNRRWLFAFSDTLAPVYRLWYVPIEGVSTLQTGRLVAAADLRFSIELPVVAAWTGPDHSSAPANVSLHCP